MPIDRRYNLITLHPAKTGGGTICHIFDWYSLSSSKKKQNLIGWASDKEVFLGTLPLSYFPRYLNSNENIEDFKILLIVRNPYFRMVSNFFFLRPRLAGGEINYRLIKEYNKDLHKWKNILNNTPLNELIKPSNNHRNHLIPQTEYVLNTNIELKDINIIKLNNLNKELPIFLKKINFKYDNNIPKLNSTNLNNKDYSLFYDKNSNNKEIGKLCEDNINLVNTMYENDFKFFNFSYL